MIDTRTKVCLWVVIIGMINFLAYAIGYTIVGGESIHGQIHELISTGQQKFYLSPGLREVSEGSFYYIGIHSISIWFTVGAIILAMLTLARDRISDSLQTAAMRGKTLCSVLAVITAIATSGLTFEFTRQFCERFQAPKMVESFQTPNQRSNSKAKSQLQKSQKVDRDNQANSTNNHQPISSTIFNNQFEADKVLALKSSKYSDFKISL